MDGQCDRLIQDQRARLGAAQLAVTFSSGLAAALLGVALSGEESSLKWPAVLTFVVALWMAVVVLFHDRLRTPNHEPVLSNPHMADDAQALRELRKRALGAVLANDEVLARCRRWTEIQLVVATLSGIVSLVWLALSSGP